MTWEIFVIFQTKKHQGFNVWNSHVNHTSNKGVIKCETRSIFCVEKSLVLISNKNPHWNSPLELCFIWSGESIICEQAITFLKRLSFEKNGKNICKWIISWERFLFLNCSI